MKNIISLFAVLSLSMINGSALAGSNYIHIKAGSYDFDTTQQTVLDRTINIDDNNSSYFAAEYQHIFDNNFSIGGEVLEAQHEYTDTANSNRGDIYSNLFLFNAKYNFDITSWLNSFIGVSAGFSAVKMEGPVNRDMTGSVFGYGVGLTLRFSKHVGLTFQYSGIDSEPEDSAGNTLDISGRNFSANVSLFF